MTIKPLKISKKLKNLATNTQVFHTKDYHPTYLQDLATKHKNHGWMRDFLQIYDHAINSPFAAW